MVLELSVGVVDGFELRAEGDGDITEADIVPYSKRRGVAFRLN